MNVKLDKLRFFYCRIFNYRSSFHPFHPHSQLRRYFFFIELLNVWQNILKYFTYHIFFCARHKVEAVSLHLKRNCKQHTQFIAVYLEHYKYSKYPKGHPLSLFDMTSSTSLVNVRPKSSKCDITEINFYL